MSDKVIEFLSNKKDECAVCSRKTFLSLTINHEKNRMSIPLCDKCMVKLLEQIHDKREDIIDDLLRNKEGVSLADIRESESTIADLTEQLEESKYSSKEYDDEEDEEDE